MKFFKRRDVYNVKVQYEKRALRKRKYIKRRKDLLQGFKKKVEVVVVLQFKLLMIFIVKYYLHKVNVPKSQRTFKKKD